MERMRFTTRLSKEDVRRFLVKYGGFVDCIIHEEFKKTPSELILYFSDKGLEYKIFCEDFGMRITQIENGIENLITEEKPSSDDWFCFLKSLFGREYTEHFANLMDARHIIFDKAQLISRLSYSEMLIIIRNIIFENPNIKKYYQHLTSKEIIEVESFYLSERRFWIEEPMFGGFYLRISDTGVVTPKLRNNSLWRFLRGKFGEEHVKLCEENLQSCLKQR